MVRADLDIHMTPLLIQIPIYKAVWAVGLAVDWVEADIEGQTFLQQMAQGILEVAGEAGVLVIRAMHQQTVETAHPVA